MLAKGGEKEGQGPKGKGKGQASANKATDNNNNGVWYAHIGSESGDCNKDWCNLTEMNLGGYDEPWSEYPHDEGEERLEQLAGLYLNNEVAQPYIKAPKSALKAVEAALSTSIPNETNSESDHDSMPPLLEMSNSEPEDNENCPPLLSVLESSDCSDEGEYPMGNKDDAELFSKFDPGEEISDLEDWSDVENDLEEVIRDVEEEAYTRTFNTVFLAAAATLPNNPEVNIYNSCTSCHMTPYRCCLFNYTIIKPKSITAANKEKFQGIEKGDMHIYLPEKGGKRT